MIRHVGGEMVKAGCYWRPAGWEIVTLNCRAPLPGTPATNYVRLPMLLLILVGPLMGALFVAFLPFIGFAMVATLTARKAYAGVRDWVAGTGTKATLAAKEARRENAR